MKLSSDVKKELLIILICSVIGFAISRIILHYVPKPSGQYVNCELASFHPDISPAMKKACRDRSANDFKQK